MTTTQRSSLLLLVSGMVSAGAAIAADGVARAILLALDA